MARLRLTDKHVTRTAAPNKGRLEFFDTEVTGLVFRITDKNARSFSVRYRYAGRKWRHTLGSVDKGMGLATARDAARDALEQVRKGTNPITAKAAAGQAATLAYATTFGAVADSYLKDYVAKNTRPKTYNETQRILAIDVKPAWEKRPISSLTRADVAALLATIGRRRHGSRARHGGEVQQNRTLARLSTLFGWAVEKGYLTASPVAGMKKGYAEKARDRALDDDEIVWFWKGCEQLEWPWQHIFKLLLLTAQRRSEVGTVEWSEIDLAKREWTIPPAKSKNGKEHIVALSKPVLEMLTDLLHRAGEDPRGYLFTTTGSTPVSGYGRAKRRLDEKMEAVAGCPVPEWILHDLRRTATTGMARLKVAPHVADKILNHTSGTISGVAAVYNRFEYLEERKAALEAWAAYVLALLQPKKAESNVVRFQR